MRKLLQEHPRALGEVARQAIPSQAKDTYLQQNNGACVCFRRPPKVSVCGIW